MIVVLKEAVFVDVSNRLYLLCGVEKGGGCIAQLSTPGIMLYGLGYVLAVWCKYGTKAVVRRSCGSAHDC